MEKNTELKMLSTMELIAENVMLLKENVDEISVKLDTVKAKVDSLETKMDSLETRMDSLETRMDALETRVDKLEVTLNARIDEVEMVLREEIKTVYKVARQNEEKIELLLFPYQDKAISVVNEVAKISSMEQREEMIIETVGEHSEAIRNIQDYLHIGNKPAKKKLHIFKNYRLD